MESTKKMAVVSFTAGGQAMAERIRKVLEQPLGGYCFTVSLAHKPEALKEWCRRQFQECDVLVFIGAMGIAVRSIAPFLESKRTDPAVLVMDERGNHVISVLSGHIGGGNELTCLLARALSADPVITTASDVNQKIAIDVFAVKNDLMISDMDMAKAVAAAIVAGEPVSFSCEGKVRGKIPRELSAEPENAHIQVAVTGEAKQWTKPVLQLIPKAYVLGIGCRKGKTPEEIETRVEEELDRHGVRMQSIRSVATIDLKKNEEGLLAFCEKYGFPITFYTAEELKQVPGVYAASEFVKSVAGVENVCERAAVRKVLEEQGKNTAAPEDAVCMKIKKSGRDGVTVALAERDWSVTFE